MVYLIFLYFPSNISRDQNLCLIRTVFVKTARVGLAAERLSVSHKYKYKYKYKDKDDVGLAAERLWVSCFKSHQAKMIK